MTPAGKQVVLAAAVAENGVIGAGGDVPWHLPEDLAHFKRLTIGHVVVMGRRTFEAIGRPLPRRTNVVITRQSGWSAEGVLTAGSLEEALVTADEHSGEVMVIGGGEVYAAALRVADVQVLSEVHLSPAGDTCYPEFDRDQWAEVSREQRDGFDIVRLERSGR